MLRAAIVTLALASAGSAAAQDYLGLQLARDAERTAAEAALRQRDIQITNDLSRLQSQVQTSQAMSDIAALQARPVVPTTPFNPNAPPPRIDTSRLAQIPDAALADSDAKVRAAAANRR